MAKSRTRVRCSECGRSEPKWVGQCPDCGAWGTMAEEAVPPAAGRAGPSATAPSLPARPIADVPVDEHPRAASGIGELDRVLGGGLVPGSVVLLGGEPGAGKSTLLLQAADALARGAAGRAQRVLYVSAEESPGQVRLRAERLGALAPGLLLACETDLAAVLGQVEAQAPDVLVLDSIQALTAPDVGGIAGGVAQVRECAAALVRVAKARGMATVLVGHVTKDGNLAGPRVLEHLVDTVCDLSGDRHHALRLLRATKNRFGPAGEVGCFEMAEAGLRSVADAGRLFVGETPEGTSGVAVTLTLEGTRPLACEVQSLVADTTLANPRRVASGLDGQRLALLVAVLDRRADVVLRQHDVYASTVGGVRLTEPAVDLALCLAVASSRGDVPVARGVVALAEVGLAGDLRLVAQTERRLAEAARLGFSAALLPHAYDGPDFGLQVHRARDVAGALGAGLGSVPTPA
jgi:DNA repair protein RadA/Sms